MASSTPKVVLITGSNTGLGFEITKALYSSNVAYEIVASGRSEEKVAAAIKDLQTQRASSKSRFFPLTIDVESDESIAAAVDAVTKQFGHLDVLINNAGGGFERAFGEGKMTMREMWQRSWGLNVSSTQMMTQEFMPLLLKSSDPRLLFITSGTSTLAGHAQNLPPNLAKSPPAGWPKQPHFSMPGYRSAKAGMNMMMREWHRILREDGVKVWCVSPGYLATGLGGVPSEMHLKAGAEDPALGGEFVKDVVEGKRDEDVGKIVSRQGIQAW